MSPVMENGLVPQEGIIAPHHGDSIKPPHFNSHELIAAQPQGTTECLTLLHQIGVSLRSIEHQLAFGHLKHREMTDAEVNDWRRRAETSRNLLQNKQSEVLLSLQDMRDNKSDSLLLALYNLAQNWKTDCELDLRNHETELLTSIDAHLKELGLV